MRMLVSALFLSLALPFGGAFAEQARSADDIVDTSAAGGICIGASEDCADAGRAGPRPGFDMVISFGLDSAELTPEAARTLADFARALRENRLKAYDFVIEGHTDALGATGYNALLSQRRADAVARFLREHGVEPARISTLGLGTTHPRTADPFDPANRRVEVRVTP